MNNYQEHDQVYLFGFSRGAYTARAVCSLLAMYGRFIRATILWWPEWSKYSNSLKIRKLR
jgi:hypothetical protein